MHKILQNSMFMKVTVFWIYSKCEQHAGEFFSGRLCKSLLLFKPAQGQDQPAQGQDQPVVVVYDYMMHVMVLLGKLRQKELLSFCVQVWAVHQGLRYLLTSRMIF